VAHRASERLILLCKLARPWDSGKNSFLVKGLPLAVWFFTCPWVAALFALVAKVALGEATVRSPA